MRRRALQDLVSITHTLWIARPLFAVVSSGVDHPKSCRTLHAALPALQRAFSVGAISIALVGCPQLMDDNFVISIEPSGGRTAQSNAGTTTKTVQTSTESGGQPATTTTQSVSQGGVTSASGGATLQGGATPQGGSGGAHQSATSCSNCSTCTAASLSEPVPVTFTQSLDSDWVLYGPAMAFDRLTLYFAAVSSSSREQIVKATRASVDSVEFSDVQLVFPNVTDNRGTPFLSPDGLNLYFYSNRWGGSGDRDIWKATRNSLDAAFSSMDLVGGVNSARLDHLPSLSPDQLTIFYVTYNPTDNAEIWKATRTTVTGTFANPVAVPELNSPSLEGRVAMTPDGRRAYFSSSRAVPNESSQFDIWTATVTPETGKFQKPERVLDPGVNSTSTETDVALSTDGTELFFISNRSGKYWIYRSSRSCI